MVATRRAFAPSAAKCEFWSTLSTTGAGTRKLARHTRRTWLIDRYSSAVSFTGWVEGYNWIVPDDHEPLAVAQPGSWLLRDGWKLGGAISIHEVPGT